MDAVLQELEEFKDLTAQQAQVHFTGIDTDTGTGGTNPLDLSTMSLPMVVGVSSAAWAGRQAIRQASRSYPR